MGDAVLVEVAGLDDVLALHARLVASAPDGVVDIVPAAQTVLVTVDRAVLSLSRVRGWVTDAAGAAFSEETVAGPEVVLDIRYDGPDLAETAELLGVSVAELVGAHAAATWTVAFTGFAPGFGYLVSSDWPFDVPRLDSPRTRVPAGAVGVAGVFSGAYPRETPGGWRLLGTTDAPLFDPTGENPALLAPGARVRIRAVEARERTFAGSERTLAGSERTLAGDERTLADADAGAGVGAGFRVEEAGLLATVQDLGRSGAAALGIARSGAMDRRALGAANRLVGNPDGAAAIEITLGGFRALALADLSFAVTGGSGQVRIAGRIVDPYAAHRWPAGAELEVGWIERGARAYLAVRGGVDAPTVRGSRATDILSGLGPAPLAAGDVVRAGPDPALPVPPAPDAPWGAPDGDDLEVELAPGPRADWFTAEAGAILFETTWTVSGAADRVGIRLDGPALVRARRDELPSEGMVPGALQVPPSGRPTILGPDAPVTGGYPVIAVVTDAARDALAQARPGSRIRFRHARPTD
ncbi:urea amidolyase family protein [Microbacterium sp. ET2]|uniref:5-oxoprolinase subunit B/C family protein n=1 Tax=Microbacterium albipurpureum TaxID=3050384 RepID=UPI00259CA3FE|nr:urea amidolyase family protein [Microbacterium sp. ET2 (Ac-2212)]WJL94561.1 urea amidolyase family protein [Microbacterium sp. ET2 (Ac-2212)]